MKILILGGTGAMGTSLVHLLATAGNDVFVTTRSARKSEVPNVQYLQGNAHDMLFLKKILQFRYDVLIDFMVYKTEEFRLRRDIMLERVGQYIFLSTSRVYAESKVPITENSLRLLDVANDKNFLKTDDYALAKARQEDMLRESRKTNWTIVRPYITYNVGRLQLGVFEKEDWLFRALNRKIIVFPKDIAEKVTTMTYGENVANGIAMLTGNADAFEKTIHITTSEFITWDQVLKIYQKVFEDFMGFPLKVKWLENSKSILHEWSNMYSVKYDRLFDRKFDNTKINILSNNSIVFTSPENGLSACLKEFLKHPQFREIHWRTQAWMDRETGEKTNLGTIEGTKNRLIYLVFRYVPWLGKKLAWIKHIVS